MIRVIKFMTGEEVIAECRQNSQNELEIKNPLRLIHNGNDLGFIPWIPIADFKEFIPIPNSKILVDLPADPDMESQYNKVFSKIVTPSKKLQLVTE